eukprot:6211357-Pleurochrysis_carterae.AAC.1
MFLAGMDSLPIRACAACVLAERSALCSLGFELPQSALLPLPDAPPTRRSHPRRRAQCPRPR